MYIYTDHFQPFLMIIEVTKAYLEKKKKSVQISQYAKFDLKLKHITHDSTMSITHPVKLQCTEIQK